MPSSTSDALARAHALLAHEKRLLEMVATGCELSSILRAMCAVVEELVPGALCSVLLVDHAGCSFRPAAAPSLPAGFTSAMDGRAIGMQEGPCAAAALLDQQVLVPDIASDPRWQAGGWCALALEHGLRACWSTPIKARSGDVAGTFAIYFRASSRPDHHHQALVERFTHVASIAMERAAADEALRRHRAYLAGARRFGQTGCFSWRLDTDEITWSDEIYRIYDVDPGTPPTFAAIWSRIHPDDAQTFREVVARARTERADLDFCHRLQMADGRIKYLHIIANGIRDDSGRTVEYVGAVRDVPARERAGAASWQERLHAQTLLARQALLTRRERQVMRLAAAGLPNKQIGAQLGIAEITVKVHRGQVMRKMAAGSFAELVRMADLLDDGAAETFV